MRTVLSEQQKSADHWVLTAHAWGSSNPGGTKRKTQKHFTFKQFVQLYVRVVNRSAFTHFKTDVGMFFVNEKWTKFKRKEQLTDNVGTAHGDQSHQHDGSDHGGLHGGGRRRVFVKFLRNFMQKEYSTPKNFWLTVNLPFLLWIHLVAIPAKTVIISGEKLIRETIGKFFDNDIGSVKFVSALLAILSFIGGGGGGREGRQFSTTDYQLPNATTRSLWPQRPTDKFHISDRSAF